MQKTINGTTFRKMILTGVKFLDLNRSAVDALNVFPVPDGDTGTNMSLTIQSSAKELAQQSSNNLGDVADAVSKGALKGARGNSGVILSQILRGFCSVIREVPQIDVKIMAKAFKAGAEVAYKAVSKPKEGTMLTVIRVLAEQAPGISRKSADLEVFLEEILREGDLILAKTPDMLDVLKKAGVVDAGGKGLLILIRGFLMGLRGEEVAGLPEEAFRPETQFVSMDHADITALGDIEFGYCTEFFIINLHKRTTHADIEKLREKLMDIGDSVLVIGDLELVKVHVHTNKPGQALTYGLQLGELDKLKIENMLEQNRQLKAMYEAQKKEMGMLAVSAGEGLSAIFKDLGVDVVVEGGQTMNPSANDIAEAVRKVNASHVFIFPNNKNIILAAEQAKALVEGKTLHVIPTKTVPQGISSVLMFNPEASVEENKVNMSNAIDNVVSGQVTYAVRDTSIDGLELHKGDYIGMDTKHILSKGGDLPEVTMALINKIKRPSSEMISLYYGADVREEDAEQLLNQVQEAYPDCEVDLHFGGQPVYYYIVSLE